MLKDISGSVFGRLTVTERAPNDGAMAAWVCKCSCGNTKIVRGSHLRSGRIASCGCLSKEKTSERRTKHGMTNSRAYSVWEGMKSRCENMRIKSFQYYGGRGIIVCARWQSFENFLADMGEPPVGMTIERKDTNGNYEPSNCIWASWEEQQNNRRNTRLMAAFGIEMGLAQWARKYGIKYDTLRRRIDRSGMTLERALTINQHEACERMAKEFA